MRTLYLPLLGIACCALALSNPVRSVAQSDASVRVGIESRPGQKNNSPLAEATPEGSAGSVSPSAELPDSPGSTLACLQQSNPAEQNGASPSQSAPQSQSAAPPAPSDQPAAQDQKPQRPVGTAAAEAPKVSGITAAQPAGVAIAPAKQRRVRTIVLRVGAIIGASAALGTVIALSEATPSKPPGAH